MRNCADPKVEIYLNKLREQFGKRLKKVILFGSKARRQDTDESDYDFVLVFDKVTPKVKEILDNLSVAMLLEYGMVITDFPLTEGDLERKKFNPLFINVKREGILL